MASIVKTTGKALATSAKVKTATKLAKTTRKTVVKGVKTAAVTKAAKGILSNTGDRTRKGAYLAIGLATAGGGALLLRRRRAKGDDPGRSTGDLNDPALARKVESEIFRPSDAPKNTVSVNVEYGVVFLRGTVRDKSQVAELERGARSVDGVKDVQNLLHLPGEPAPAKKESHDQVERPV